MKMIYKGMTELTSKKFVSKLTGRLAKSRVSRRFIPHFAKTYQIPVEEAEKEIQEYSSLNDFFTRRLKEGVRFINPAADALVSPVDALITGMGEIKNGTILNIKGQQYTISEMLQNEQQEQAFHNGSYIVLYLSPRDYHRIHAPISAEIIKHEHKLGKVYPVNNFGLTQMKRVLSRNERLITYLKNEATEIAVVKVGALNVASIQLSDQLQSTSIQKGAELAYFEFGSTVVLLIKEGTFQFEEQLEEGEKVKLGQKLGRVIPQS